MTPEVGKRLAEITVDPKTVVLTKKAEAASSALPKVTGSLSAGSRRATRRRSRWAGRRSRSR